MARLRTLLSLTLLPLLGGAASAATVFTANMTNLQEVPPAVPLLTAQNGAPRPTSFGGATFELNDAQTALSMIANVYNIDITGSQTPFTFDNLTLGHIHAPAPPGAIAPVVWGFFGTPFNDTSHTNLQVTPFANSVGGTVSSVWNLSEGNNTTLIAQIPSLLAGLAYINFHTVQFPGGEIRGQLNPIPIPGALPLFASALGFAGWYGWRRKRCVSSQPA